MSKTCVKVTFDMEEEGAMPTRLVSNDDTVANKFFTAVAKSIVVGDPGQGAGSPRFFMFHEQTAAEKES